MCPQSELRATGDQDRSAPISMISGLPVANLDKPACPTPRYLRRHVVVLLAAASRAAAVIHLYGRGGAARSGPFNTLRFQMNIAAACAFRLTIIFFHEDLLFQHQRRRARAHALVQLNASACAVACDLVGPAASAGVTAARRELSQVRVIQLHVGLDCSLLIARGLHAGTRGDRRDPALAEGIGTSRLVLGPQRFNLALMCSARARAISRRSTCRVYCATSTLGEQPTSSHTTPPERIPPLARMSSQPKASATRPAR